ncbi:MAG: HRDC domain-containing protein [Roseococcus sp.]
MAEIAARRPTCLETLRGVPGVGESKLARYGEAVLTALAGAD